MWSFFALMCINFFDLELYKVFTISALHMQVRICIGDPTCNSLVLTFSSLDWLHCPSVNRHNLWPLRQVPYILHRILMHPLSYRSKDNPQGLQRLLPCPTSCMAILVTRYLERFHILDPRKHQGLNCLLLCQFP